MLVDKELQKDMLRSALEPIESMVRSGSIDPQTAIGLVIKAVGQFSDENYKPEYKRFRENMGKIFENELFFDAGYRSGSAIGFKYRESSHTDSHFLFKLYEHLRGREYDSPEQLKKAMQELLENKRLLEVGCGPGFGLKVFQNLGAKATGIELRGDYGGRIPNLDIRYGNAINLDKLCKDEEFDIIYSQDFFAQACIDERDANRVAKAMYNRTKDGGQGIHLVTYEQIHPFVAEFGGWLDAFQKGQDLERWQRLYDNLSDEEREEELWTNRASLDPQYLARQGFKIIEYGIEDGDLVIVTKK
ncbi:MAG: class I SAM-dependent methyltransferase [Candidatus Aenigmatarchaeota archaeon]